MTTPNKRTPPFSLRLTFEERAQLERKAGQQSLGSYVKQALFSDVPGLTLGAGTRRVTADQALLAKILAKLGETGLADSMRRLADDADLGAVFVDDALKARLHAACDDIAGMRDLLMHALGKRSAPVAPAKPKSLTEEFNAKAAAPKFRFGQAPTP